jgi:hypothetical protein
MARRLVALPDTDGELAFLLGRLEEVLFALAPFDTDDEAPPDALGAVALEAAQHIRAAVQAAERRPTAQLFAPGGTFEMIPVRVVDLDENDLASVGAAVAALGAALLPAGDEFTAEVLSDFSDDRVQPGQLVAGFARAHGLIDMAANGDTLTLAARTAGDASPVVLSAAEAAAYERLTDRALAVFYDNDFLARFLYRGT